MKKKADNNKQITINIFSNNKLLSGNKLSLDGKTVIIIIVLIIFATLIIPSCSPEMLADLIRYLCSIVSNC
jgi:hypothetical protein